jgi:hypothetical protein
MSGMVSVRRATTSDARLIRPLLAECADGWMYDRGQVVVADEDGVAVGCAVAYSNAVHPTRVTLAL